jgi:hypothetical protein
MSRLMRAALSAALLMLAASPAAAHEGNADYRSVVRAIVPATDGLTAQVLNHDDALQVVNRSDRTVVVLDDRGRPYARIAADGLVQVNRAVPEPSHGAEEPADDDHPDREHAGGLLLASLDGAALAHAGEDHDEPTEPRGTAAERPRWRTLDRSGRFRWHDHRIKYGGTGVPPQVTDASEETKVKDWRVPIVVDGERGAIAGTLTWVGEPGAGSSFPTAAVVSLVVLALLAVAAVVAVRRRRAAGEGGG